MSSASKYARLPGKPLAAAKDDVSIGGEWAGTLMWTKAMSAPDDGNGRRPAKIYMEGRAVVVPTTFIPRIGRIPICARVNNRYSMLGGKADAMPHCFGCLIALDANGGTYLISNHGRGKEMKTK